MHSDAKICTCTMHDENKNVSFKHNQFDMGKYDFKNSYCNYIEF